MAEMNEKLASAATDALGDMVGELFGPGACYTIVIQEANSTKTHYCSNLDRSDGVDMLKGMAEALETDNVRNPKGTIQ